MSHDASLNALRRCPVSSSTTGGFQNAKSFSPRGDRSSVTSSKVMPVSRVASSPGLPTVAEARHHLGVPP